MKGYEILSLDDLPAYESESHGDSRLMPLRHTLGVRAFGANCWTADVGKTIVPRHEEDSGNEEMYVVVRGRARFVVDDETVDAPPGTLVYVPSGEMREAFAEEPGTVVLAVGGTVGAAFTAHGWDEVVVAWAEAKKGDVGGGRAIVEDVAARHPAHWGPRYNVACFEARFGDKDRAFESLRSALALDEAEVRGYLDRDTDLDSLRDDPRWSEL